VSPGETIAVIGASDGSMLILTRFSQPMKPKRKSELQQAMTRCFHLMDAVLLTDFPH
jgi:hypothetical protein